MKENSTSIKYVVKFTDKDNKQKKRYFTDIKKFKEFKKKLEMQRISYCEYKC